MLIDFAIWVRSIRCQGGTTKLRSSKQKINKGVLPGHLLTLVTIILRLVRPRVLVKGWWYNCAVQLQCQKYCFPEPAQLIIGSIGENRNQKFIRVKTYLGRD